MREYEVMHIQSPSTTNLIPIINQSGGGEDEEDPSEELIEFDLHRYGGPPLSPVTPTTTSTTVVIREKRSFLHRLSHNLTITRFLGFRNNGDGVGGVPGTRIRQGPDMKLKQRWILLIFILTSILLILLFSSIKFKTLKLASHQLGVTLDLEELTDRHKCPACFGVNLCPAIFKEEIELNDWNKFAMSRLVNVKNIFYATWTDGKGVERQVVLKKLAHNNELDELDKSICERHHGSGVEPTCEVSDTVVDLIEKYKIEQQDVGKGIILNGEHIGTGGSSDLLLCPSHRKMDFIVEGAKKALRGQHHDTILANVLTMLLLNPEPLLLQAFPQKDGWPFPKYYGACGRIIAEEYVGRRLTSFLNEPFPVRASLAKQLLEMANKFYDNPTNFILYMTDMTPDNFAVDDSLTLRAIDLENFILVDKETLVRNTNPENDKLLESESMPCEPEGHGGGQAERPCFSFSTEDLCVRPHTDHNHYAVCAGLLAPGSIADEFPFGLLHSLPPDFLSNPKLKTFEDVLLKCKDPKLGKPNWHYTRVEAADELIHQLDIYLNTQQPQQTGEGE